MIRTAAPVSESTDEHEPPRTIHSKRNSLALYYNTQRLFSLRVLKVTSCLSEICQNRLFCSRTSEEVCRAGSSNTPNKTAGGKTSDVERKADSMLPLSLFISFREEKMRPP